MGSLIKRAQTIRKDDPSEAAGAQTDEFVFDESSGISKEEQKEIITEIDHLVTDNRIQVTPEILRLSPIKKGFLFPLLVNLFFVLVLAGGIFALVMLFRRSEGLIMEDTGVLTSAEGMLLQELKKESEEKLLEKNKEIQNIMSQLKSIDRERQDLESNMNARVQERETQLRKELETELEAERTKLRAQGISEEDIDKRLSDLESQKTAEFDSMLAEFKNEAEADRQRAEENLKKLQEEYNSSLSQANTEREQILADSKAREDELRAQLEEKERELEAEKSEAKRELRKISEQKEQEEIINSQLIGLYDTIRQNIREGRFDDALSNLDGIREFLNDESVVDLPSIQQRRDVEFFVVDSLTKLVESEKTEETLDTDKLLASANLITSMKDKILRADEHYRVGETNQAEALYREVLQMIPEVDRSHNYFLSKIQTDEQSRRSFLDEHLTLAEEAFNRQAYSESLQSYRKALEYIPKEPDTLDRMMSSVRESGFMLGVIQIGKQDTAGAQDPFLKAERLAEEKRYNEAIIAYIDVVNRYRQSNQAGKALEGIKTALNAKSSELPDSVTQLQSSLDARLAEIDLLKSQRDDQNVKILELESSLANLQETREQEKKSYEERIGELETSVTRLELGLQQEGVITTTGNGTLAEKVRELERDLGLSETERTDLKQENASLQGEVKRLKSDIEDLKEASAAIVDIATSEGVDQQKLALLAKAERNYREIKKKYSHYTEQEDVILQDRGKTGLIETKLHLDEFLTSSTVEASFPGFWKRIKQYDQAFEQEGRKAAMQDVIDVINDLSGVIGDSQRMVILDEEIDRDTQNPLTVELLKELRSLLNQ